MTVAYLMKEKNMELKIAFEHVRERRKIVDPLPDNITQLISFEKKLRGDDCDIPDYLLRNSQKVWGNSDTIRLHDSTQNPKSNQKSQSCF